MALSGLITYESLCFNEINRCFSSVSRTDEAHPSQLLKLPGKGEDAIANSGLTCHQCFQWSFFHIFTCLWSYLKTFNWKKKASKKSWTKNLILSFKYISFKKQKKYNFLESPAASQRNIFMFHWASLLPVVESTICIALPTLWSDVMSNFWTNLKALQYMPKYLLKLALLNSNETMTVSECCSSLGVF